MVYVEPIKGLPELDLDNLVMLNVYWNNGLVSLTANGDITNLPTWLLGETLDESGKLYTATSCVVIAVDRGANITQILPPMNYAILFNPLTSYKQYCSSSDYVHDSVLLDYCDAGQSWDPLSILPAGRKASTNLTSFLHYSGIWGDFQYPDDHPRQKIVPYFGLKGYVSGPTGPNTKQLVRKGLFPDHLERRNLLGWRAWISGIAFIGLTVCLVLGIKRSLK
ncbi:hypothetical protein BDP55DRAFT_691595 [Colletotrichum godetiae]|uniref:Uncharacterized protein n=1 Tax=Colletotrichum godetiae TaxID=1209918 RepID=A0AAJ0ATN8_9PEZI|nr:uncharacterized protein BDP55DRAFT_691595 [Colletotrichum godetiae]KAK1689447.1 hypothetical protein BDP55DRAFT_691595 [Colletotrichum godetiae]